MINMYTTANLLYTHEFCHEHHMSIDLLYVFLQTNLVNSEIHSLFTIVLFSVKKIVQVSIL
jgi:hypothetical protein